MSLAFDSQQLHTWRIAAVVEVVEGRGRQAVDATLHLARPSLLVEQRPGATHELVVLDAGGREALEKDTDGVRGHLGITLVV